MYNRRDYRQFNLHARPRDEETRHSKAKFWVWIIFSIATIVFISVISNFYERCKNAFVFESFSLKFCLVCFIFFILVSSIILYRVRMYRTDWIPAIWAHSKYLVIIDVLLCIALISLFGVAIYPAYKEASICYIVLFTLFIINLGCLILYD